jgi:hypothetical protein
MLSTHLNYFGHCKWEVKDDKEQDGNGQTLSELQVGTGHRQYCWKQHSKALLGRLLERSWSMQTLRRIPSKASSEENPFQSLKQRNIR